MATPRPRAVGGDPVADLAVAALAVELQQAEGAGEAAVAVLGEQRQRLAGRRAARRTGRATPRRARAGTGEGTRVQRWIAASWQAAVTASRVARAAAGRRVRSPSRRGRRAGSASRAPPPRAGAPARVRVRVVSACARRGTRAAVDLRRPDRLDAGRLRRVAGRCCARAARRAARARAAAPALPRVSLIVAALPRGGGDRGEGRQRARARLAARAARADRRRRRRRRAGRRRHRRARPRGRRRRRARAAARRQGARAGRRRARRRAASCWRSPTPTRCGSRGALRALAAAFADPRVGYACGRVAFVNEGGTNQEGVYWRYEMWMRGHESALASVTAGNGAIYAVRPRGLHRGRPGDGPRPLVPVQHGQARAGARSTCRTRARRRRWSPRSRASGRRKRRMMSHAWPIVLRGGLLDPRGYPPLYALMVLSHRVLRYATPLLHVVAAAGHARAARAAAARGSRAAAQAALLAAAAAGGRVRSRPLLLARYYVLTTASLGRRALRPPAPRHRRRAGTRRRARGEPVPALAPQARARRARRRASALVLAAPLLALAALAIRLEGGGHFIYRQRRVGRDGVPFDLYKLRTMVTGAETMGAGLIVDAGDDRITRVGALLRRTSLDELPNLINVLRGEMSLVGPAPDRAGPGRPLHGAPAPPARRPARASPAGPRSTAAPRCRGTSGSSSTSPTSSAPRLRHDLRILAAQRPDGHRRATASTAARPAAGASRRLARRPASGPLSM